jgi:radical SAM superfamily enzyme YgiQ (UPF0313 family)
MNYQVILFTDAPGADWLSRGYGCYRLASDLRAAGYSVLTVDYSSSITWEKYKQVIDLAVGDDTLVVGYSTTWFPYRELNKVNPRYSVGFKSKSVNPKTDFVRDLHPWYYESLSHCFSQEKVEPWIEYVKSKNKKIKCIVGGAKSNEYVFEPAIDNIFLGFSENMLMDYVHALSGKGPKRIFNKIVDYDPKASDPRFDFKSSPTRYVDTDCIVPGEVLTIEFARGCIFNCSFCSYPHRNQQTADFIKYKEVIRSELLENWEKWGCSRYMIVDDTFNDSTEKLQYIKEVIETLPFKPKFWAYCRMDLFHTYPEQIQLMKDIGVTEVYYGMETWHDKTAKAINKGGKLQNKINAMKKAKEIWGNDVYVTVGLVAGLPHDTVQSVRDASTWFKEEGHECIDWFNVCSLTVYPPTDNLQYKFFSDIEKDLDKYGYTFPIIDEDPMEWHRSDSGDINSKSLADSLMHDWMNELAPYQKNRKQMWFQSALTVIDPRLDYEYLLHADEVEFGNVFRDFVPTTFYHQYITEYYWPKLIAMLSAETTVSATN